MKNYQGFGSRIVSISKLIIISSLLAMLILIIVDQTGLSLGNLEKLGQQLAGVIMVHKPKTATDIQQRYQLAVTSSESPTKKVRIILMPGHEPDFGGAEFGRLKERELATQLAVNLSRFLQQDPHFQVVLARNNFGWNTNLTDYFNKNWSEIKNWQKSSHDEFSYLVSIGSMKRIKSKVSHLKALNDSAVRLYGLTKWANENDVDIILHLHFNDYSRRRLNEPGKYSGLAIYVPDQQYGNSQVTREVAKSILERLAKYNAVSDLPAESEGIIDEQELIAVGANNTSDAASMLIEYSYIYESPLLNPKIRDDFISDLAYQTYLGLQDFFARGSKAEPVNDTLVLLEPLRQPITRKDSKTREAFVFQTALIKAGVYPPSDQTFNTCPRSGLIASCTEKAVKIFQEKYRIEGESGQVGEKTLSVLNQVIENRI